MANLILQVDKLWDFAYAELCRRSVRGIYRMGRPAALSDFRVGCLVEEHD